MSNYVQKITIETRSEQTILSDSEASKIVGGLKLSPYLDPAEADRLNQQWLDWLAGKSKTPFLRISNSKNKIG